jgi:hypothetical protein
MKTLATRNVICGNFPLGRKKAEANLEYPSPSCEGMFSVRTVDLIQAAHDGYQLASNLIISNPVLSSDLSASCDSLISVAVPILREPRGDVPIEIADTILFVIAACTADEKLVSESAKPTVRSKRQKKSP